MVSASFRNYGESLSQDTKLQWKKKQASRDACISDICRSDLEKHLVFSAIVSEGKQRHQTREHDHAPLGKRRNRCACNGWLISGSTRVAYLSWIWIGVTVGTVYECQHHGIARNSYLIGPINPASIDTLPVLGGGRQCIRIGQRDCDGPSCATTQRSKAEHSVWKDLPNRRIDGCRERRCARLISQTSSACNGSSDLPARITSCD